MQVPLVADLHELAEARIGISCQFGRFVFHDMSTEAHVIVHPTFDNQVSAFAPEFRVDSFADSLTHQVSCSREFHCQVLDKARMKFEDSDGLLPLFPIARVQLFVEFISANHVPMCFGVSIESENKIDGYPTEIYESVFQ